MPSIVRVISLGLLVTASGLGGMVMGHSAHAQLYTPPAQPRSAVCMAMPLLDHDDSVYTQSEGPVPSLVDMSTCRAAQ